MEIKRGIPVSPGLVIAHAFVLDSEEFRIPQRFRRPGIDAATEIQRFAESRQQSIEELDAIKNSIADELHREHAAMIFETHQMILRDPVLAADVQRRIERENNTAEYAVTRTFRHYKKLLRDLEATTFAHRATDFSDIEKRLLANLLGGSRENLTSLNSRVVLVAKDLTPSQTAALDREHVVGIVTDSGGPTSHTAILANALSIPAVVGVGDITDDVAGGDLIILDGNRGLLILNPDPATLARYETRQLEERQIREKLIAEVSSLQAKTLDDVRVRLLTNIEFVHEIPLALRLGAEGVGLFRTEFIFSTHGGQPSEQAHYETYTKALNLLEGRPFCIRTMDFGADKFGAELGLTEETNPFLGCRSIRLSLMQTDLFRTQLRAVLRASELGDVRLMFPMVSSLDELRQAKRILDEVKSELRAERVRFNERMPVGIMVEVPAVAIMADRFAVEVDFFSIGTNDLIQYTLAVDRTNPAVANLYRADHPAVLYLIDRTTKAAQAAGIECTMCGEMGGDARYSAILLGLGLRQFSVGPSAVPAVKKAIRSLTLDVARTELAAATGIPAAASEAPCDA